MPGFAVDRHNFAGTRRIPLVREIADGILHEILNSHNFLARHEIKLSVRFQRGWCLGITYGIIGVIR